MPFDAEGWLRENPPPGRNGQVPNRGNPGNLAGGTGGGRTGQSGDGLIVPGRRAASRARPQGGATQGRERRRGGGDGDNRREGRDWRIFRAKEFILGRRFKDSIQGQDGSGALINTLCVLIEGFDLTPSETRWAIDLYNSVRCQPPWSEGEISHAIDSATKKVGSKPRGKIFLTGSKRPVSWRWRQYRPVKADRELIDRKIADFEKAKKFHEIIGDEEFLNEFAKLCVEDYDHFNLLKSKIRSFVNKQWKERRFVELIEGIQSALLTPLDPPNRGDGGDGGGGGGDGEDEEDDDDGGDDRPEIVITTRESDVSDECIMILSDNENIYKRCGFLVSVVEKENNNKYIQRDPESPRIVSFQNASLRKLLTKVARIVRMVPDPEAEGEFIPRSAHPPDWLVPQILSQSDWPNMRNLEYVVESPIFRPDGTILDTPGYDERTEILYRPNQEFPKVPESPTKNDAFACLERLEDLVCDFPFSSEDHRSAWLAAAFTPFARFAINGPCPLFLLSGNVAGSGKTKLCDLISIMTTGRECPRTVFPENDEEMRKKITSILMSAYRMILFDNVDQNKYFGGESIDAAITGMTWKDRILGSNDMEKEFPIKTLWYVTGNNLKIKGDMDRRIILCNLQSMEERPEVRVGFKYPLIEEHLKKGRGSYVSDILTILRAFHVAGRPRTCPVDMGSFVEWSRLVRCAVKWACGVDPLKSQDEMRVNDSEANNRKALIAGWAELPVIDKRGYSVAGALQILRNFPSKYDLLREVLMQWSRNDELPTPFIVGARFRAIRNRVVGSHYLHGEPVDGVTYWSIRHSSQLPSSPISDEERVETATGGDVPF